MSSNDRLLVGRALCVVSLEFVDPVLVVVGVLLVVGSVDGDDDEIDSDGDDGVGGVGGEVVFDE
jgi:hypothetical protein